MRREARLHLRRAATLLVRTHVAPAADTQGSAVVEIADSGCGIQPDVMQKIFNPGFTTKGVGVGTGLGLAICHRIVANHRGKVDVESVVGKGTTFRITLPVGMKS